MCIIVVKAVRKTQAESSNAPRNILRYAKHNIVHLQYVWFTEVRSLCSSVVTHGSTVAIQALHDKRHWLGCASSTGGECHKASHPGLYMEGDNWRNCYGEVFQIYHTSGPGDVLVGDLVGIYYPREQGWWFSMAGGRGHKANCPGLPNSEHGFANELLWYRCCGEVFLIYARGKAIGTPILEHDDITLLFLQPQQWVSFVNDVPDSRTCSGTDYPPPPNKYDVCWGEIFEIWLQ